MNMWRRWVGLFVFFALLGAGAGAVVFYGPLLPKLAQLALQRQLDARGLPPIDFNVDSLGTSRLVLSSVRVGRADELTVARIDVAFAIDRLSDRRLETVELTGLRVRASVQDDGTFSIGSLAEFLAALPAGDGGDGGGAFSAPRIVLRDAGIDVRTPYGPATGDLSGTFAIESGAVDGGGRYRVRHAFVEVAGAFTAKRGAAGRIDGTVVIVEGKGSIAGAAVRLASGELALTHEAGGLPRFALELALAELTAAGIALGPTTLSARFDGIGFSATTIAPTGQGGLRAEIHLDVPDILDAAPTASLSGAVALADRGAVDALLPDLPFTLSRGRIGFALFAAGPELRQLLQAWRPDGVFPAFEGEMEIDLDTPVIPGLGQARSLTGVFGLRGLDQGLVLSLFDAVSIRGIGVEGETGGTSDVTIKAPADRRDVAAMRRNGAGWAIDSHARLDVAARDKAIGDVEIDASAQLAADGWRATVRRLAVTARDVALGRIRATQTTVDLSAEGTGDEIAGSIHLKTRLSGRLAPDLALRGGRVALGGDFAVAGDRLTFRATPCIAVEADAIETADYAVDPGPILLCGRKGAPLLTVASLARGPRTLRLDGAFGPARAVIRNKGQNDRGAVADIETAATPVSADYDAARGDWRASAAVTGATVASPAFQAAGTDITVALTARGQGNGQISASADLDTVVLRDTRAANLFAPVFLSGRAGLAGAAATFDITAGWEAGEEAVSLQGRYDPGADEGTANIRSASLFFTPHGRQPHHLLPVLRGKISDVSGEVIATATAAWADGTPATTARIEFKGIGATTAVAEVAGINGTVRFDSLLPPTTPTGQRLTIDLLDPGVALKDGSITFDLDADQILHIKDASWPWAGGTIRVADATIDMGKQRHRVTLAATDVDLSQLVALLGNEEIDVTGIVAGEIPVFIDGDDIVVRGGRLASTGEGGVIRYTGGVAENALRSGGESGQLLLDALRNFQYESLELTLDGAVDGDIEIGAHVRGANPDLYNGYPFALNFSVGGELANMLRQGLTGYRLPETIRRKLEERE